MAKNSRGHVIPGTSSSVKETAGRVLEKGKVSSKDAKSLAGAVMRHEPAHGRSKKKK